MRARRAEQGELGRVGTRGRILARYVMPRFEQREYLPRPLDHRRREPGEPPHVDTVRPVGAAGLEAMQEHDLVPRFAHGHVEIARVGELLGELCELVIMSREDRLAPDRVVQEFGY